MYHLIRPDKLLELVFTFISDHVGFKFVEPFDYDLGRIYSDGQPDQPIMLATSKENDASNKISKFSYLKQRELTIISLGEENAVIYTFLAEMLSLLHTMYQL